MIGELRWRGQSGPCARWSIGEAHGQNVRATGRKVGARKTDLGLAGAGLSCYVGSRSQQTVLERRAQTSTLAAARRLGLRSGDIVLAGVSGGPDSTALALLLLEAGKTLGFRLRVAHLIHDFRGRESYDDAEFVRQLAERIGCPCTVDEVDVPAYQRENGVSSFEQAARNLRYAFLARTAREVGAGIVAVGHTADDQAETALLHIARGSGLHGLRGMAEVGGWPYPEGDDAPRLWRPLLNLRRADTIGYCRQVGVEYRDDSTNYMEDFARNRVRLNLLPALAEQLNPRIVDALGRLSRTAATQLDYLEQQAAAHWPAVAPEPVASDGTLRLNRDALTGIHRALQLLLLRQAWVAVKGDAGRLTEAHLQRMAAMASGAASGKSVALPGGYAARTQGRWLRLSPADVGDDCPYPALRGEFRLTLPWGPIAEAVTKRDGWEVTARSVTLPADAPPDTGDPMAAYLSPAALADGATVRCWQPGDRMQPLGMSGHRKLQDVFTDAGMPREWRRRSPLVVTPAGIAWAVGVRIADWAAVGPGEDGVRRATLVKFDRSL